MDEESKEEISRKDAAKSWLKNPMNLLIIAVFLGAFFVRLYYFSLTSNQPLWWDEAGYMAAAKNFAGIAEYKLESIRTPGLPFFASLFFRLGIVNDAVLRFFIAPNTGNCKFVLYTIFSFEGRNSFLSCSNLAKPSLIL